MVISLTTTPMMCSRLLKVKHKHGRLYNWSESFFQWIISTYASALEVVLNHPAPIMLVMAADDRRQRLSLHQNPQGLFPAAGYRASAGHRCRASSTSPTRRWWRKTQWFEEQVRSDPDVGQCRSRRRERRRRCGRQSRADLRAAETARRAQDQRGPSDRPHPAQDLGHARAQLCFCRSAQDIRIGGRQGNAQYQYTLQTQDLASAWPSGGRRSWTRCRHCPRFVDVSSDQQNSGLSSNVVIDRDTASRLGLTAQAVDSALYDAFGQRQVSTMYKSINQYHVVLALRAAVVAESRISSTRSTCRRRKGSQFRFRRSRTSTRASRRFRCRTRDSSPRPRFPSICLKACR